MQTDREVEQLVKEGRHLAAFKLLRERQRGREGEQRPQRAELDVLLNELRQLKRAGTPFTTLVALFFGTLLIIALVVLGLTFVGLRVSEWTLFPALDRVTDVVAPWVFLPGVLPVLALAVLVLGFSLARRFRSPGLFVTGTTFVSFGLVCVWLFPLYISMLRQRSPAELELPLLIVGGVVTLLLVVCGAQLMAQAR